MHLTPDRNLAAARARKPRSLLSGAILFIVLVVVILFGLELGLELGHWLRRVAALMHPTASQP